MTNRNFLLHPTALIIYSFVFGAFCLPSPAFAHGGGLNSQGCHNNRKTGDYHCHSKGESRNNNENQIMKIEVAPPVNQPKGQIVIINSCYDGDTCTTMAGEKLRLACIDTPELRGKRADPIPAKAARDYLNGLVAGKQVAIRRITKDRYDRTVAELSKDGINIQQLMVSMGHARIYERYADPCPWAR